MSQKIRKPDLLNAREGAQKQAMEQMLAADHCPFCEENLDKYHQKEILKNGKHWLLTWNQWPYFNTKHHLLFILKTHCEELSELDPDAGRELIEMCQWAEQEFGLDGGGVFMRFGDTEFSGGTIPHIHAQMMVPDIDAKDFDENPVRAKFGRGRKRQ